MCPSLMGVCCCVLAYPLLTQLPVTTVVFVGWVGGKKRRSLLALAYVGWVTTTLTYAR
jgi:hypothetical protein